MQPTPPPPEGGRWAVGCFRKMAVAPPPHRRGPVGTTPRTKNNILNRLQESNYTPYACLGTTYGTEISSRSQPCHRLDQKTKKNDTFWQKRPKMARFGVRSLFGPRPLPISPRAGVENKKGALIVWIMVYQMIWANIFTLQKSWLNVVIVLLYGLIRNQRCGAILWRVCLPSPEAYFHW